MTDTNRTRHAEELDEAGNPTGYALCNDAAGIFAITTKGTVTCPDCLAERDVAEAVNRMPTDPAMLAGALDDLEATFPDDEAET